MKVMIKELRKIVIDAESVTEAANKYSAGEITLGEECIENYAITEERNENNG